MPVFRRRTGLFQVLVVHRSACPRCVAVLIVPVMFLLSETPPSTVQQVLRASRRIARALPFFLSRVPAGFPSPADDYLEGELDLNELLIQHPAATFYVRLAGDSMVNAGLFDGDILVVDRAVTGEPSGISSWL